MSATPFATPNCASKFENTRFWLADSTLSPAPSPSPPSPCDPLSTAAGVAAAVPLPRRATACTASRVQESSPLTNLRATTPPASPPPPRPRPRPPLPSPPLPPRPPATSPPLAPANKPGMCAAAASSQLPPPPQSTPATPVPSSCLGAGGTKLILSSKRRKLERGVQKGARGRQG